MLEVIREYLKSLRIKMILRNKIIKDSLDMWQIDFIGWDEKYHSILVAFNETRIFCTNGVLLLGNNSYDALIGLDRNHRVFDTREAWIDGRFAEIDKSYLKTFCNNIKVNVAPFIYNDFELTGIKVTLSPVFSFIVGYKYRGIVQKSLILVADQITCCSDYYKDCQEEFADFIAKMGLRHLVTFSDSNGMGVF